jgi:hypothetical protein
MDTRRATVWLRLGPEHPVLRAAGIRVAGEFPVFVSGRAVDELERNGHVDPSPGALLFGVVLHAREDPPGVDVRPFRSAIPALLRELARVFHYGDDVPGMLADAVESVRMHHGVALAARARDNAAALGVAAAAVHAVRA